MALKAISLASLINACSMELARRNTIRKYSAPHLNKHNRNYLKRFKEDLFSLSVLNSIENKYERDRSSKKQKLDNKDQ